MMPDARASAPAGGHGEAAVSNFPLPLEHYVPIEEALAAEKGRDLTLWEVLSHRVQEDPFNVVATIIFLLAIGHTFMAAKFMKIAHRLEHEHHERIKKAQGKNYVEGKDAVCFKATLFHFLGEIEAIFGIWLIPLVIAIVIAPHHGPGDLISYIDSRNYVEPMFVVVIMAIASTRPIIQFAEMVLSAVASLGGRSPAAWWFSIMTIAPILGSFITEPAAMTIAALLLGFQFYELKPSNKFAYATIGLLFVNVSVGGTLTHFAAPPVLMVAGTWGWDMTFMFTHFGWKAVLGILIANSLYFFVFKKEFAALKTRSDTRKAEIEAKGQKADEPVPFWIILVHIFFLAWTVLVLHHPPMFIGAFLFFLAFTVATDHHQFQIQLKGPVLVGFFLAALVTHGGFQSWWIAPVLSSMTEYPLFIVSTLLTAFNDNAAITFLASQVPAFNPVGKADELLWTAQSLEYAVVAGAVSGGGLTVIANAPNPAGQSILQKYFEGGVSPIKLFFGAAIPTTIIALCFMGIPH